MRHEQAKANQADKSLEVPMAISIVVIFGKPGSGKSTVSEKVVELFHSHQTIEPITTPTARATATATAIVTTLTSLDLDTCVPQWMKDNFAQGIYPTLSQRKEFAVGACDYVDEKLNAMRHADKLIISFSFVNTDLRDVFRERFLHARWVLIDTNDAEAQHRIDQREDHFYKGARAQKKETGIAKDERTQIDQDNSEWNFAKVEFDHVVLDGIQSVEENAKRVLDLLLLD
jgi:gluconate kinase